MVEAPAQSISALPLEPYSVSRIRSEGGPHQLRGTICRVNTLAFFFSILTLSVFPFHIERHDVGKARARRPRPCESETCRCSAGHRSALTPHLLWSPPSPAVYASLRGQRTSGVRVEPCGKGGGPKDPVRLYATRKPRPPPQFVRQKAGQRESAVRMELAAL